MSKPDIEARKPLETGTVIPLDRVSPVILELESAADHHVVLLGVQTEQSERRAQLSVLKNNSASKDFFVHVRHDTLEAIRISKPIQLIEFDGEVLFAILNHELNRLVLVNLFLIVERYSQRFTKVRSLEESHSLWQAIIHSTLQSAGCSHKLCTDLTRNDDLMWPLHWQIVQTDKGRRYAENVMGEIGLWEKVLGSENEVDETGILKTVLAYRQSQIEKIARNNFQLTDQWPFFQEEHHTYDLEVPISELNLKTPIGIHKDNSGMQIAVRLELRYGTYQFTVLAGGHSMLSNKYPFGGVSICRYQSINNFDPRFYLDYEVGNDSNYLPLTETDRWEVVESAKSREPRIVFFRTEEGFKCCSVAIVINTTGQQCLRLEGKAFLLEEALNEYRPQYGMLLKHTELQFALKGHQIGRRIQRKRKDGELKLSEKQIEGDKTFQEKYQELMTPDKQYKHDFLRVINLIGFVHMSYEPGTRGSIYEDLIERLFSQEVRSQVIQVIKKGRHNSGEHYIFDELKELIHCLSFSSSPLNIEQVNQHLVLLVVRTSEFSDVIRQVSNKLLYLIGLENTKQQHAYIIQEVGAVNFNKYKRIWKLIIDTLNSIKRKTLNEKERTPAWKKLLHPFSRKKNNPNRNPVQTMAESLDKRHWYSTQLEQLGISIEIDAYPLSLLELILQEAQNKRANQ